MEKTNSTLEPVNNNVNNSEPYIDEYAHYWDIEAPKITPFHQRPPDPTEEEAVNQLRQYPLSFFDNAYAKNPIFNGSLYGYFMAVSGASSSVLVLVDDRPIIKKVTKKGEAFDIEYYQHGFLTQDNVRTTDNYVNNKEQVLKGRKLRAKKDEKGYKNQKSLSVTVSGSAIYKLNTPNKEAKNISYRNNLIIIDFDFNIEDKKKLAEKMDEVFEILKADKYTKLVHISFSGDGFAVVVEMSEIDANENFALIFKKLEKYYKETYNLIVDASCSNIGRLRYISYDPNIYVKQNILVEISQEELVAAKQNQKVNLEQKSLKLAEFKRKQQTNPTTLKSVSDLVDLIISSGNRFAEGYDNWLQIARSLHEYPIEWDRLNNWRNEVRYHKSLNKANEIGSNATIGTFYHYCVEAGISIKYEKKRLKFENQKNLENTDVPLQNPEVNILNKIKHEISKFERVTGELLVGYLSDVIDKFLKFCSSRHINLLCSPAGSGKTSMVLQLDEKGFRCLFIVPTQAIIKNKKLKNLVPVYGTTDIQKHIQSRKSIICTFDKASQLKVSDYDKFDYIIIDESHLLFTESYRMKPMVLLLQKIENYILNVRNNTEKTLRSTNIILMSGTPTGEELYFGLDKNDEILTKKKCLSMLEKER